MKKRLGILVEWIDGILDMVPSYDKEDGWCRFGGWGCRLGMHRIWDSKRLR